jgi:hypothetical protein
MSFFAPSPPQIYFICGVNIFGGQYFEGSKKDWGVNIFWWSKIFLNALPLTVCIDTDSKMSRLTLYQFISRVFIVYYFDFTVISLKQMSYH